jgi:hypothetical protein
VLYDQPKKAFGGGQEFPGAFAERFGNQNHGGVSHLERKMENQVSGPILARLSFCPLSWPCRVAETLSCGLRRSIAGI